MATFKSNNFKTGDDILARQRGKPIIYVEGESDYKVFNNYWFHDRLERISFRTVAKSQGCAAVVTQVAGDRNIGVPSFGLVDRDKLMADDNWALLRETNDATFGVSSPYPHVKIALRWEMENYLIDPVAVENYLAPAQAGRAPRPIGEVEADLLDHTAALIPHAALTQTLHHFRERGVGDGYTGLDTKPTVDAKIRAQKLKTAAQVAFYEESLQKVEAFSNSADPIRQQLSNILRIVNGKAMIERLRILAKSNNDITFHLASEIKRKNAVPPELLDFVNQCENAALI